MSILLPKGEKRKPKRRTSPPAETKAYADKSRELGCIATGFHGIQMHHLEGREFKFNGVHVGHYWQIPIVHYLHDVSSNNALNVTHHKKAFHEKYGAPNELLRRNVERCRAAGVEYPEEMLTLADEFYKTHEDTFQKWMENLR